MVSELPLLARKPLVNKVAEANACARNLDFFNLLGVIANQSSAWVVRFRNQQMNREMHSQGSVRKFVQRLKPDFW